MVLELKPPVDQDKGMVISEAVRDAGCAWYFGDDISDIKAFAALRAREAADPRLLRRLRRRRQPGDRPRGRQRRRPDPGVPRGALADLPHRRACTQPSA